MSTEPTQARKLTYGRVRVAEIPKSVNFLESSNDFDNAAANIEGNKENWSNYGSNIYGSCRRPVGESKAPMMNTLYTSQQRTSQTRMLSATHDNRMDFKQNLDYLGLPGNHLTGYEGESAELSRPAPSAASLKYDTASKMSVNDAVEEKGNTDVFPKTNVDFVPPRRSSGFPALRIPRGAHVSTDRQPLDDVSDDDDDDDVDDDDDNEEDLMEAPRRVEKANDFAAALPAVRTDFGHENLYSHHRSVNSSTANLLPSQKREHQTPAPSLVKSYVQPIPSTVLRSQAETSLLTNACSSSSKMSELFASLELSAKQQMRAGRPGEKFFDVQDSIKKLNKKKFDQMDSCRKSIRFADCCDDSQRSIHIAKSASASDLASHKPLPMSKLPSCGNIPKSLPTFEIDTSLGDGRHVALNQPESANLRDISWSYNPVSESSCGAETYRRLLSGADHTDATDLSQIARSSNSFRVSESSFRTKGFESSNTGDLLLRQKPLHVTRTSHTSEIYQRPSGCAEPLHASRLDQRSSRAVDRPLQESVPVIGRPLPGSGLDIDSTFANLKTLKINGNSYLLLKIIGQGGSSKVYKAISPNCDICAVKCVSFENADESMISGYQNEIKLLKQLQKHEEIVRLYDHMFDQSANMLYVVMECGDMDLQTFFRLKRSKGHVLQMLVRPFWIEMLYAVQVLHKQGIVHSDLKPANFIVVSGQVKLIDFGIAKTVLPDCTSVVCDEIVGTFNYMSPEAITDLNGGRDLNGDFKPNIKISVKSDVWSLGCILHCLVFSCTPFEHIRNQIMKLQAIVNPNYKMEIPPTQMPHVVDVIRKCLDRNPKNRPSIEELLEHPFVTNN